MTAKHSAVSYQGELLRIFVEDIISKHTRPPGEGNRTLTAKAVTALGVRGLIASSSCPRGKTGMSQPFAWDPLPRKKSLFFWRFFSGYVKGWVSESFSQKQEA